MSHIDEIITARLGEATPGPIEQVGAHRRAAIQFGHAADRPDRRTLWLESRAELLALINAASHQLSRWDALEHQRAQDAHPSQPTPAPAPEPAPPLSDLLAPPPPTLPVLAAPAVPPAPAPVERGPFQPAHPGQPMPPMPPVSSAVPVPPSAAALADPEPAPSRGVRPYLIADPQEPGRQQEAVVPDPHRGW